MKQDPSRIESQNGVEGDEDQAPGRYYISEELSELNHRALPIIIAGRMGYMSQQAFDGPPTPDSDIQPYIDRIADFDSHEPDFLLPDTPLKEAVFRVLLAHRNLPMTAAQISEHLVERWAMSAYPRELSPEVIERLLNNSPNYCIARFVEGDTGA
jgi:hypothetical protein